MPTVDLTERPVREIPAETVTRATNNVLLSDYIGKYVAGQISTRYTDANLQETLNRGSFGLSISWG